MKFKKDAQITTSDFWYDIFDGGYIKPENLLESPEDIKKVQEAIKTLKEFHDSAEENDVLEYL